MALIVANATRLNFGFVNTANSVTWSCALACYAAGGYDEATANIIAAAAVNAFYSSIATRFNELVEFVGVTALDLTSETGSEGYSGSGVMGTVSGSIATVDQCMVVTWLTGARGRSNRGRSFFRGLSVVDFEDSYGTRQWKPATVDEFQENADAFNANMTANGYPLAVVSRVHSSYRVVNATTARAGIFSQRRTGRQPG